MIDFYETSFSLTFPFIPVGISNSTAFKCKLSDCDYDYDGTVSVSSPEELSELSVQLSIRINTM